MGKIDFSLSGLKKVILYNTDGNTQEVTLPITNPQEYEMFENFEHLELVFSEVTIPITTCTIWIVQKNKRISYYTDTEYVLGLLLGIKDIVLRLYCSEFIDSDTGGKVDEPGDKKGDDELTLIYSVKIGEYAEPSLFQPEN